MKAKKTANPLKNKQIKNINEQLVRFDGKAEEMSGPVEAMLAEIEFENSDFSGAMIGISSVVGSASLIFAVLSTGREGLGWALIYLAVATGVLAVLAAWHNNRSPAAKRAACAIYQHRSAIQGSDRDSPKPQAGKVVLLGALLGTAFLAGSSRGGL